MIRFGLLTPKTSACFVLVFAIWGAASGARAENIVFPTDAGVLNASNYGVDLANDSTDDTTALQNAVKAAIDAGKILYLPNGTYNVSNTIEGRNGAGEWDVPMILQGQSRAGVVIKLKDNATGFTVETSPKPVFRTGSQNPTGTDGSGNQAFRNSFYNLTIDVGSGNLGAQGIDYLSNNIGCIRDVTIKSTDSQKRGSVGISMRRYGPGPSLLQNVSVDGFKYGLDIGYFEYSITADHLTLTNQKNAGLRNGDNMVTLRYLNSTNSVPAILQNGGGGMINLTGGNLSGGAGSYAIARSAGHLFVRSTSSTGYTSTIQGVSGTSVSEYSTGKYEVFPSAKASLALSASETPTYFDSNLANWRSVAFHGAIASDGQDDTAAIQAAFNSGKSTIYFPKGTYHVRDTLSVGSGVKHIIGMESFLETAPNDQFASSSSPRAVMRFPNSGTVVFERFRFGYSLRDAPGAIGIQQAGGGTLVVKDVWLSGGADALASAAPGDLFLENVSTQGTLTFTSNQNIWARQLNVEARQNGMISNSAANLWILGLKTEEEFTALSLTGGSTEVLGGLLYPTASTSAPAVSINQGRASLSLVVSGNSAYSTLVRETRDGTTGTLLRSSLPGRGGGCFLPLFRTGVPPSTSTTASATAF